MLWILENWMYSTHEEGDPQKHFPLHISLAPPHSEYFSAFPESSLSGEQQDRIMLDAARPLQKTNNLPLGEGLAELCVFVLLFFSPFSFPDCFNNYLFAK